MELLEFIFRIGVVLAVYNFLWWLIMLGIKVLRGGRPTQLGEVYLIKMVRYGFLVDVVFLFTVMQAGGIIVANDLVIAALILLMYFVGRIQSSQKRQSIFSFQIQAGGPGLDSLINRFKPAFDIRLEALVVVVSLGLFAGFYFEPSYASNGIANWFLESILDIEDTVFFGFVFKVIGFFFMISVITKMINGIMVVLSGDFRRKNDSDNNQDDGFDDYTEVN